MPILIVIIFAVGWYLVRRIKGRLTRMALQHVESWEVALPLSLARDAVSTYMPRIGYESRALGDGDGIDIYFCGDVSVTRLLADRDVRWKEVPRFAAVVFEAKGERVSVSLVVQPLESLLFCTLGKSYFMERFREEAHWFGEFLSRLSEARRHFNEEARSERSRAPAPPPPPAALPADLATLGVRAGASWEEVQRAYRDACMKYHPDRLAGQNVAPHLKDLAVRRFTEVSAAYDRLRSNRAASVRG